jgi:hypothetical protein
MVKEKKLCAGVGAKCSVITKFVHPKKTGLEDGHRTTCILKEMRAFRVNRKEQQCYVFEENNIQYHAVMRYFKVLEEGEEEGFFFPAEAEARKIKEGNQGTFKEPKVKWQKSKAKRILYDFLRDGTVTSVQAEPIEEILKLHEEFSLYDPDKFKSRLRFLRKRFWSWTIEQRMIEKPSIFITRITMFLTSLIKDISSGRDLMRRNCFGMILKTASWKQ